MPVAQRAAVNTEKRGNVAIAAKEEKVKYTIYTKKEGKKGKAVRPQDKEGHQGFDPSDPNRP